MSGEQRAVRRPASDGWVTSIHASAAGDALGSGFLIDERRVLTCAHVARPAGRPEGELWVAFPKLPELMTRRIQVEQVVLPEARFQAVQPDLAVLVLAEPAPPHAAARLRRPTPDDLVGRTWWSFGFPNGRLLGNSADGGVGESLGFGWVRLDTGSRYPVRPGFSGAALWSPEYDAVVGVLGQANGEHGDAQAITLWMADLCLPEQKLARLTEWSAEAAGEGALAAWGWRLDSDPEARRHWRPRARGVSTDAERGFRFRGRTAALGEIVRWLDRGAERQALVVTGSPGVGKSAVLGRIVTTADAAIAAALPPQDDAVRAPLGSIACAVHAKGKTALAVAEEIARAASAALPAVAQDLAPALRDALSGRRHRDFNVVIDALDEAASPLEARAVITAVVQPLVETCSDLGVRVVLGSRRRDNGGGLLTVFGTARHEIDLDDAAYFAEADLAAYALATLQLVGDERPGNPYQDERVAAPVAARIAALAEQNFLIAGLVARTHGMADREPVAPAAVAFTPTVDAALREYLKLLPPVAGCPAWDALTALAYAEPPGMPLTVWQATIGALYGIAPGEEALRAFARSSAANFLVEASDTGSDRLFRLFHQALNDALLGARADLDATQGDERALTRTLLGLGRSLGWDRAPAYLRRALPGHAARGGLIDDLLTDDAYLLHVDLTRLIPQAYLAGRPAARHRATLLRRTPRAIAAGPAERAAMFTVTEVREGLPRGDYAGEVAGVPYAAQWASVTTQQAEAVLEGHQGEVIAVCEIPTEGRSLLASLDESAVRIWDPASGELLSILPGQESRMNALCTVPTAAGPWLATANADGTVRLWDPLTGHRLHALHGHTGEVRHLCAVRADGRELLASAGEDRTVRLWDPVTGHQVELLEGYVGPLVPLGEVYGAAADEVLVTRTEDRAAGVWQAGTGSVRHFVTGRRSTDVMCDVPAHDRGLIAGGRDTAVRIWDHRTGAILRTLVGATGGLTALCAVPVPAFNAVVVAGTARGNLVFWQADGGEPIGALHGHLSAVKSVCTVRVNGRAMVVSGGADRTVRIWHPDVRRRSGNRLEQPVQAAALAGVEIRGRTVLVSAGGDQEVRYLSASDGEPVQVPHAGPPNLLMLCQSRVDTRPVLAGSGRKDRGAWLWHPMSGRERLLMGVMDPIRSIHPIRRRLATGHLDGTVRIWDPQNSRTLHQLKQQPTAVLALCTVDLPDQLLLAAGTENGTILRWRLDDVAPLDPLTGHAGPVQALCLLPGDGPPLLASGSADHTVRLWDPLRGDELHTLHGHSAPVTAVHPVRLGDRLLLASASIDRTVRLWDPLAPVCLAEIPVYSPAHALTTAAGNLVVGLADGLLALRPDPGVLGDPPA
ncbi:trypsin-like peptidase domain-containing protein [Kitasatospora sp. NBC_01250]|uniref:trypsin-like peptidase domain-containing protein n=1 Tax=Kitasatospora sp. NBC_01250 TaxID=2903571 RepID=UPI002E322A85|nr:trypsin-like peptidase domain-containing protein [Kitasatospora sp. NBC_01250]